MAASSAALARPIDPIGRTRPPTSSSAWRRTRTAIPRGKAQKMDLFDFVNLAADMGLDGVEPTSYYFPPDVDPDYLPGSSSTPSCSGWTSRARRSATISACPPGPSATSSSRCVADLDRPRRRARRAGDPDLRRQRAEGRGRGRDGRPGDRGDQGVAPHAAEKGVTLALENHGGITATPEQLPQAGPRREGPRTSASTSTPATSTATTPTPRSPSSPPTPVNVQVKTEIRRRGKPKEEADLARSSSASSARRGTRATSSSNTRRPRTR